MGEARVFRIRFGSKNRITFSDGSHDMTIRRRRDRVREYTVRQLSLSLEAGTLVDRDTLRLLGLNLYEMIFFNAHANKWFEHVYENSTNLQMVLEFPPNDLDLMATPWEFMYVPQKRWTRGGKYLLKEQRVSLVRQIGPETDKVSVIESGRFLVVDCLPSSPDAAKPGYQAASEAGRLCPSPPSPEIDQVMAFLESCGEVRCLRFPTLDQLDNAVGGLWDGRRQSPPHVVHLVGHGRFQSGDEDGFKFCLCPRDPGPERWEKDDWIADAIGKHTPELVILQTCKGGKADSYRGHEGAAITLVKRGVPNVVALQQQILVGEATSFVTRFYMALREGRPAEIAVKEGRHALESKSPASFGLPVAYFQRKTGFSLPPAPNEGGSSEPDPTATGRSPRTAHSGGAMSPSQEFPVVTAPAVAPVVEPAVLRASPAPAEPSPSGARTAGSLAEAPREADGARKESDSPLSVRLGSKGT